MGTFELLTGPGVLFGVMPLVAWSAEAGILLGRTVATTQLFNRTTHNTSSSTELGENDKASRYCAQDGAYRSYNPYANGRFGQLVLVLEEQEANRGNSSLAFLAFVRAWHTESRAFLNAGGYIFMDIHYAMIHGSTFSESEGLTENGRTKINRDDFLNIQLQASHSSTKAVRRVPSCSRTYWVVTPRFRNSEVPGHLLLTEVNEISHTHQISRTNELIAYSQLDYDFELCPLEPKTGKLNKITIN
ncbi:hypothetical protein K449DRAFT_429127 [Hypoxylon sp. EC38]|nr:hypothetical protein K449DRAFT_429127 [Hypoxylon sp. EC38]